MSWSQIRGHERQVEAFTHVVARGRLAHGYLFVGPAGIGKRLFARELARALLCETPPAEFGACGHCEACILVNARTHPDLFEVCRPEEANELPMEVVRELCRGFSLKTARGKGKVAILDDADDLNEEAANCFLKTLEEPPPRSVFILVGTTPDRQLPTIRSRCQTVRFAPLPDAVVRDLLQEEGGADPALLDRLVRLAAGSPGQARELTDEALWQFRRHLLEGLARPRVDSVELARSFVTFAEEAGKEGAQQRRRAGRVLRLLIEALTDALAISLSGEPRASGPEERVVLVALAERAGSDTILALLDRCLEAEGQVNRYVQLALVLEGLMDGLGQSLEGRAPLRLAGPGGW
jgi:DNA polymerase-3 subunit delta'